MIHCIGNSHANLFTRSHPGKSETTYLGNFSSTSIGPVIAYNFFEHHHTKCLEVVSCLKIAPNDKIMLVVGEVDCRWHIPKQIAASNKPMESVVEECVRRFLRSVLDFKNRGYNVVTWCGHPSTTEGHREIVDSPVWGDCLSRNKISLEWKKQIQKLSKSNHISSISIIDELIKSDGLTDMSYFSDYCHLNPEKAMPLVLEKIKDLL